MKKLAMLVALLLAGAFVQAQCSDPLGCVEVGPDDPIVVAYMLTTSGGTAFLGEDSKGGIEIAIAQRGQVLGRDIELVGEDSLCSAEGGQTAAQRLAADESIVGIVGSSCSSEAAAGLPIISEAGMLMVSPSNTAPRLTEADPDKGGIWQPGYYRTAHNDLFQGKIAADFAYTVKGYRKVATVHDGSPYAESLQAVMADEFAKLGGEVVFQGAINVGDTDFTAILTEIAAAKPDIIYYPIFQPEADFFTAQARTTAGLEKTVLMGADAALSDSFPEAAGAASVGVYLSGPYVEGEAYDKLLAAWADQIGGVPPSGFHAHAYDATNMILDAVEKVAVDNGGTLYIGRQAMRDALNSLSGYSGIIGQISCNATGDCATGEAIAVFEVTQAELDGNWPPPVAWKPGQ
jgi:branched-chain amino acid transport system substrate-binding protein